MIDENNTFAIAYTCNYDTKVYLVAKDEYGNTYKKTYTVKNIPFKLKVDNIYYTSKYVTGHTTPGAKISLFIGDSYKEYKATASNKGDLKIKIKK